MDNHSLTPCEISRRSDESVFSENRQRWSRQTAHGGRIPCMPCLLCTTLTISLHPNPMLGASAVDRARRRISLFNSILIWTIVSQSEINCVGDWLNCIETAFRQQGNSDSISTHVRAGLSSRWDERAAGRFSLQRCWSTLLRRTTRRMGVGRRSISWSRGSSHTSYLGYWELSRVTAEAWSRVWSMATCEKETLISHLIRRTSTIFDAASFYAHNEMEIGDWRCFYNNIPQQSLHQDRSEELRPEWAQGGVGW